MQGLQRLKGPASTEVLGGLSPQIRAEYDQTWRMQILRGRVDSPGTEVQSKGIENRRSRDHARVIGET